MKIVYVIDSVTDLTQKINMLRDRIPAEIHFVVRADLEPLVKTYGINIDAIYYKNLTKVIHTMLLRCSLDDLIICYASLKFDEVLLNKFCAAIGNKSQIVGLMPNYNSFEKLCNSVYNSYVKSIFKAKDALTSAKLQFIPSVFLVELLATHMGNRLFETPTEFHKNISVENKESNKSMKSKTNPVKFCLLATIITLLITAGLLATIAFVSHSYIAILIFVVLYILNFTLCIIFACKEKFDHRFLG